MALLDRLKGHLDDDALMAAWVDVRLDGVEAGHPHLAGCAACRARLATLSSWLDDVRADGSAEADEAFTAERLAAQHAQIMRRLETAGRPAKVIAFPRLSAPIASNRSPVRRWVASAAAAGLIAGVALGNYMDLRHNPVRPTGPLPAETILHAGVSDDDLLWHLEELASSHVPEALLAFDSLTPRARDAR